LQVTQLHKENELVISFELFPPKTKEGDRKLFETTIPQLLELRPGFMTCTYGAGGSTHDKTLDIVSRIKNEVAFEAASHLTCVGASREEIGMYLEKAREAGISNIVALRGDPPKGDDSFRPHPDGFAYANELIAYIREVGGFDIMAAGYPEGHPESQDKYEDWRRCVDKVEAGANLIITQLFYDNNDFFEFSDFLTNKLNLKVPIVPGVLPILNLNQIQRFCGMCGANLPEKVVRKLETFGEDKQASRQYGVELATEMCADLIRFGVPGIHIYTLNRSDSTREVMRNLGLLSPHANAAAKQDRIVQ
jgi:methylenetetrahydrofolate reductase (NADPH)